MIRAGHCRDFSLDSISINVCNHTIDTAIVTIILHCVGVGSCGVRRDLKLCHIAILIIPLVGQPLSYGFYANGEFLADCRLYVPGLFYYMKLYW